MDAISYYIIMPLPEFINTGGLGREPKSPPEKVDRLSKKKRQKSNSKKRTLKSYNYI